MLHALFALHLQKFRGIRIQEYNMEKHVKIYKMVKTLSSFAMNQR